MQQNAINTIIDNVCGLDVNCETSVTLLLLLGLGVGFFTVVYAGLDYILFFITNEYEDDGD